MKQARFWLLWLLVSAAAMLMPQAAFAQPKKPGKPPAAAPAKPGPAAPPAAGAGGDLGDIDSPTPATGDTPPPAAGGDTGAPATGSSGGICEIDPSACPKASDIKALADKNV